MKKYFVIIISFIISGLLSCSCCMISWNDVNIKGLDKDYDFYEDTLEIPGVSFGAGQQSWWDDERSAFPDSTWQFIYCMKISFALKTCMNPSVILHSFSFTTIEGDTIPYVLFYRDTTDTKEHDGTHFLPTDSFPIRFTSEMVRVHRNQYVQYKILAECHKPKKLKRIYVNYDIEIAGHHFVVHSLYRRRLSFDCRPKFW